VARDTGPARALIAVINPEKAVGRRSAPEPDLSDVLIAQAGPERHAGSRP
jgi:hypothetical protein